jgi:hypothetical protein
MKELFILTIITGLSFLLFLGICIWGFVQKDKKLKQTSLILLLVSIGLASWIAFKLINKTYSKVTDTLRPRTGDEIYDALFGQRQTNCIKMLNYQDQIVPKIDYAIWLHFETCTEEMKRVLSKHNFTKEIAVTKDWNSTGPLANENWFKPESLGDSILIFNHQKDEFGNRQTLYSSLDSTKVFCIDILD